MTNFEWMSGRDLTALRRRAAERFQAIATTETPVDVTIKRYRKSLTGCAYVKDRQIEVPRPVTRRSLHIYLHELAHIVLNHQRQKPRHIEEYEAETWAFAKMREHGVSVPRKSLQRAKAYVDRKIRQAEARGAKKIDHRARAFSK